MQAPASAGNTDGERCQPCDERSLRVAASEDQRGEPTDLGRVAASWPLAHTTS